MVLKYRFEYLSNNTTLINILDSLSKDFAIKYKILKTNNYIDLYVQSDLEVIEEFSTYLSNNVPMSLFFKGIDIKTVEKMPNIGLDIKDNKNKLSFCSKCLKEVEDSSSTNYYNAFYSCSNCETKLEKSNFILRNEQEIIKKENNIEYFEYLAKLINDGKKVEIKTFSGSFVFSKLENIQDKHQDRLKVLCTSLENISKIFVASKQEVVALASIEKPSISLRVNEIFKNKNIFKNTYINVRYANDLILYFLSKELEKYKIDFLYYVELSKADYEFSFESKKDIELLDIIEVKFLNNKAHIIKSKSYDKSLDTLYSKFDDNNKAQLMTLLQENKLYDSSIISFYFSSKHKDNICLYSQEVDGLLDILNINESCKIKNVFDKISEDEKGNRLINNYKEKFLDDYTKAVSETKDDKRIYSFYNIFKLLEKALNFNNDILTNAQDALLEKGPRIDYRLKDSDKFYNKEFKIEKLLQSCLSFKLAGVDENTISLGIVESLCHFISAQIDLVNEEIKLDGIALSGDMFLNDKFTQILNKSITKNYKIYYNKDFVIDKI